jgi:hypothetical protein
LTASVAMTAPPAVAALRRERRLKLVLVSEDLRVICHLFRHQSDLGRANSRKKHATHLHSRESNVCAVAPHAISVR